MYAKLYNMKFATIGDAKIAVSYVTEEFGHLISEYDVASMNVTLSADGEMGISVRFDDAETLKAFDKESKKMVAELETSFDCRTSQKTGVAVFTFDREATFVSAV